LAVVLLTALERRIPFDALFDRSAVVREASTAINRTTVVTWQVGALIVGAAESVARVVVSAASFL
jgi:hypothetical protein